uniref:Uncharacterized protein n=1 Tax=Podoviridae sp. ct9P15 TaxID=2826543 RepID=A0A8S5MFW5_9CAUD|nr:MAG TPA: hypothetical protein [Podoviridae sp. ct9P15]
MGPPRTPLFMRVFWSNWAYQSALFRFYLKPLQLLASGVFR